MTSKERTKRAIHFKGPDRVPIQEFGNPEESDLILVGSAPQYWNWEPAGGDNAQQCIDENGCLRQRVDDSIGQVVEHPLKDWDDLSSFKFPSFYNERWLENTKQEIRKFQNKYILGDSGLCLYTVFDLRGMDHLLEDFYLNPDNVQKLINKVLEYKISITEKYAQIGGVDGLAFFDDWGTQESLLISPRMWRQFLKPAYKRLMDSIHSCGCDVYMHSCGKVTKIIPDLIELGVDVLNFNQPRIHGIEQLGERFGGNVCFACSVDLQKTMPSNNIEEIQKEARLLIESLGKFLGGLIAEIYQTDETCGIQQSSFEAAKKIFQGL